jgi:hypothetical protein
MARGAASVCNCRVQSQIDDNLDWAPIAKLNFDGGTDLGGGMSSGSWMVDWGYDRENDKRIVDRTEDRNLIWSCDARSMELFEKAIAKEPLFPFPYFVIAKCLREQKHDERWRQYAKKCESILLKTTKVPGHSSSHDAILKQVREMLRERDSPPTSP